MSKIIDPHYRSQMTKARSRLATAALQKNPVEEAKARRDLAAAKVGASIRENAAMLTEEQRRELAAMLAEQG